MIAITNDPDAIGSDVQDVTDKDLPNTIAGFIIAIGMIVGGVALIAYRLANTSNRASAVYRHGSFDWTIFLVFLALGLALGC